MLEGIETLKRGNGRARPCALTAWLNTLDAIDRAEAQRVLSNPDYNSRVVHDFLNRNGAEIANAQTVLRHRSGTCCNGLAA